MGPDWQHQQHTVFESPFFTHFCMFVQEKENDITNNTSWPTKQITLLSFVFIHVEWCCFRGFLVWCFEWVGLSGIFFRDYWMIICHSWGLLAWGQGLQRFCRDFSMISMDWADAWWIFVCLLRIHKDSIMALFPIVSWFSHTFFYDFCKSVWNPRGILAHNQLNRTILSIYK